MTGGLINIAVYGGQDLFLTGNPEITHFKSVYRRHTNFAVESYKLSFDDNIGFGSECNKELPPIGDLVSKTYLEITLPSVQIKRIPKDINNYNTAVNTIKNRYTNALLDLNIVGDFMSLNIGAYRQAIIEYNASNDISIDGMKTAILNTFNISSVGSSTSDINLTIVNNFKDLISGIFSNELVNLNYIAENVDTLATKNIFYKQIISAVNYSYKINDYYRKIVNTNYATYQDFISPFYKFAWVKRIGHSIIDYIDVFIGGDKIDRHYGMWLDIWYELTGKKEQESLYMKMIGNVPELTTYDRNPKQSYILQIPLQFWFCRHNGLAIPLVALEYNKVSFLLKLRNIDQVAYIEQTDTNLFLPKADLVSLAEDQKIELNGNIVVDYVFLDGPERRKFAQSAHEYLIEQMQYMSSDPISQPAYSVRLEFNHPTKEIIWVAQKSSRLINDTGDHEIQWWNYGIDDFGKRNPITRSKMDFNGYERFALENANYFNYVRPYFHHSNIPADGINLYSFSLHPEENQPSGSCNFTKIANALLTLQLNSKMFIDDLGNPDTVIVWIFGSSYNVLRIIGGFGALAFA
jgi:hypothetical protein